MLQMSPAAPLQHGQPNVLKMRDGPVQHLHWNTAELEDDGELEFLCCLHFCLCRTCLSNSPIGRNPGTHVRGVWSPRTLVLKLVWRLGNALVTFLRLWRRCVVELRLFRTTRTCGHYRPSRQALPGLRASADISWTVTITAHRVRQNVGLYGKRFFFFWPHLKTNVSSFFNVPRCGSSTREKSE